MSAGSPIAGKPVTCERYHAVLCVSDLAASITFYTAKLGFSLDFTLSEPSSFAGVSFGDNAQLFLQKRPPQPDGCGLYYVVDNADAMCDRCRSAGLIIAAEPADRDYGLRDFSVRDPDGYYLTFGHRLDSPPEQG
jgi:catechol 2,3-dioxygenase-like lactoylglutathione lyase family enzyme